jgi:hypothetical protein
MEEDSWSSYIIMILIIMLAFLHWYTYGRFSCPNCPLCPPVKECAVCPVPSSQGLINYILLTFSADLDTLKASGYDLFINKYLVLDSPFTTDNAKELFFAKLRNQMSKKYLLTPDNIVYLNMNTEDKEKFKVKFNSGIIPNPLFLINGMDLIFGFQNDPSSLKIYINQNLF